MRDKEIKREYELAFLVKTAGDESAVSGLLSQFGAEVSYKSPLNEIRLAYPVKKSQQAHFGFMYFFMDSEKVEKLSQAFNLTPAVLRTLLVTPPVGKMEKPAMRRMESRAQVSRVEENVSAPVLNGGVLSNEALEKKLEEILK